MEDTTVPADRNLSNYDASGRLRRSGDMNDPDPFDEIPGLAPNAGHDVLPHVVTFQGLLRNVARTYYVSDEAIQHSWDNARFMRNDPGIMECLEQRQRSTALLGWHLEPEDEKDKTQVRIVEELTSIMKKIPHFLKYRENLLYALWYGKYGVAHRFRWRMIKGKPRVILDKWRPVNGDKLVFRYDDGSGEFPEDQVGIRVGAGYTAGNQISDRWTIERFGKIAATDHGLAYFLEHWERPLLAIHKHMIEDAEYEAPDRAGAIHGVGIRNRLYWMWYQKQETLAWLMEYLERSAFGIEIWTYPAGNPTAKQQTMAAAQERIGDGRNIVLVPRHPDSDILSSDVKRIEPGMAGAEVLDRIIREYFGHQIKRYILGQILTSETASTGLGSGVATIHLDTYLQIVRYDAINLAETITTDLVQPLIHYNWPELSELPIKFVIETESPDVEGKLGAWEKAYHMGLKLKSSDVAELIGAQVAQPGEDTLYDPQHKQVDMEARQTEAMAAAQIAQARRPGLVGPDGQPLQATTPEQDAAQLGQILNGMRAGAGREPYQALRPGMERIVYDRDGRVRRVERYRATPDGKADDGSSGGNGEKPGWRNIGGANVFIGAGGQILAGCPGLEGEDVDDLGEDEEPENRRRRDHRKEVAEHHGLKGDDLTPQQVKQLEQHPHPETGKDADGQQKARPVAGKVRFANRDYEVKQHKGQWFFRVDDESGWTAASEETAAEIERQLGAQAGPGDDVPGPDESVQPVAPAPAPAPSLEPPAQLATPAAKINPRTRVGKAILSTAADYEIPPDDLADALEFTWEQRMAADAPERQRALEAAHKLTGLYQSDVRWLKNNGFDHTSAKRAPGRYAGKLAHFDTFAQEMARDFPALGLGNPDDPNADFAAALWEVLDSDRARAIPMDDPALMRQAAEMVLANRRYDEANVLTASYEEFCKRGEVQKYRRWVQEREVAERYAKKPAKGQMGFEWKEDEHPRDDGGKFAEVDGGGEKEGKSSIPERTADTMSDAIALSSPNGQQSKRSKEEATKRLGEALFGKGGLKAPQGPERDEVASLRKRAKDLRELAARGMKPRAHVKEAQRLEAEADKIEGEGKAGDDATPSPAKTRHDRASQLKGHDKRIAEQIRQANSILKRMGETTYEYELQEIPIEQAKPTQEGEDYVNSSSEWTAKVLKAYPKRIDDDEIRMEDLNPIALRPNGTIIDGNHRHAAHVMNGEKTIMALVPVRPATEKQDEAAAKPTTAPPASLFPQDAAIGDAVSAREAAADFEASRWKGDASAAAKAKQGTMFDRLNWKQGQQGLFDESVSSTVPKRYARSSDSLPGGAADDIDYSTLDPAALAKGTAHEMEHTGDEQVARELAIDHLTGDPEYYSRQRDNNQ